MKKKFTSFVERIEKVKKKFTSFTSFVERIEKVKKKFTSVTSFVERSKGEKEIHFVCREIEKVTFCPRSSFWKRLILWGFAVLSPQCAATNCPPSESYIFFFFSHAHRGSEPGSTIAVRRSNGHWQRRGTLSSAPLVGACRPRMS